MKWSLLLIAMIAVARPSRAQSTSIWTGLGNTNLWSNGGNWTPVAVPVSSPNTAIILTGTTQTTNVLNMGPFQLNSLTFASEAGPFTINQAGGDFFNWFSTSAGVLPHIDQFSSNIQTINFPGTGFIINSDLQLGGTGSGSLSIIGQLQGPGRIVLNGPYAVNFTITTGYIHGGMTINNGVMRLPSDIAFGNGSLNFGGGTLQLINNLNLSRPIVIGAGGGTIDTSGFTANMPNTSLTITGQGRLTLTNSSGAGAANIAGQLQQNGGLTVTGANNTVTLIGNNTYIGGTTISNGATLSIDSDNRLGNASGPLSIDGGALRTTNPATFTTNRPLTLGPGGGTLNIASAPVGISGAISGAGGLTKLGNGTLGLLVANTYSGLTTLSAGLTQVLHNQALQNSTLHLESGAGIQFISPANTPVIGGLSGPGNLPLGGGLQSLTIGNNNATTAYSGNLSGGLPNGLNKIGLGTLLLAGTNTQAGPLNIEAGTLVAGSPGALSSSAPISLSPGATLDLNGNTFAPSSGTSVLAGNVLLRFGSMTPSSGATIAYNGATVSNGFLSGPGQQIFNNINTFNNVTTFNGTTLGQSGILNLNNSTIGGALGTGGTLNWTNGSLSSSGNLTIGNIANFSGVTSNGRINISGGISTGTLNLSGSPLVLGGGSTTFIEPGGSINLNGRSLDLRGALLVNNGTILNGATNVGFGSLAKGAGTYGPVNVTDGGKFSPGNSPGTVTTGSTTWNSGGGFLVEIGNLESDFWSVNGQLTLAASAHHPFTISLESIDGLVFDTTRDYTWPILHADGGIIGLDPSALALDISGFKNNLGGGVFSLNSTSTDLVVHFSAVPEPSAMFVVIAAALITTQRRSRHHSERTTV